MFATSGESRHPALFPILGESIQSLTTEELRSCGFVVDAFHQVEEFYLSLLHVYIMKDNRILSNDFSEFTEMSMCFYFYSTDVV